VDIGPKLKAARQRRNLSLRALGEQTGFSASFLSQVELGQTSPSLGSLGRIAQALGVSLASLLAEPGSPSGPIVRRGETGLKSEWSRAIVRSLIPADRDDRIAAVLVTLEPSGRSGQAVGALAGQQFAYLVRGSVRLTLDEETYELAEGDSALLDSDRRVKWHNPSRQRAEILLVTFRLP
jgi:transcriptional regulator with XRE-family HTH domain